MTELKLKQRISKHEYTRFVAKQLQGYSTIWNVYIKGHWFRSWYGYQVNSSYSSEEAIKNFIKSYYGEEWGILNVKDDPEYFV